MIYISKWLFKPNWHYIKPQCLCGYFNCQSVLTLLGLPTSGLSDVPIVSVWNLISLCFNDVLNLIFNSEYKSCCSHLFSLWWCKTPEVFKNLHWTFLWTSVWELVFLPLGVILCTDLLHAGLCIPCFCFGFAVFWRSWLSDLLCFFNFFTTSGNLVQTLVWH